MREESVHKLVLKWTHSDPAVKVVVISPKLMFKNYAKVHNVIASDASTIRIDLAKKD